MKTHCPKNERSKHCCLEYLKEANGYAEPSLAPFSIGSLASLTTFTSYGAVAPDLQAELIR
jgi:hypothetical protein